MSSRNLRVTVVIMPMLLLTAMIYQSNQAVRDFLGGLAMAQPLALVSSPQAAKSMTLEQWADLANGFRRVVAAQPDEPEALTQLGDLMLRRSSAVDDPLEKAEWLRFGEAHLRRSMSVRPFHGATKQILELTREENRK